MPTVPASIMKQYTERKKQLAMRRLKALETREALNRKINRRAMEIIAQMNHAEIPNIEGLKVKLSSETVDELSKWKHE